MAEMSIMENPGVARINNKERITETGGDQEMADMVFAKRGCCFWVPCLGSGSNSRSETVGLVWWERIHHRTAENSSEERWWTKGWNTLKKVREWSEIIAGPKWKTFIRRFNKNKNGGGGGRSGKFQYDPFSYALNFDEGPGQNGLLDDDFAYRDFSSRYAAIPISAKSSMDLGKDAPSFV
ncbi:hypothetical protein BVC80_1431g38 [Macleaya cordata]|uniref:Uncharacterized protein n=1 Tax=Macleaya cordata TaxID=56857 RepID=A0A200PZS8_MACCD|nr:hypothetical protein BVC80_1431g38 [Macleaya cordata]